MVLGELGSGWHQVTSELSYERSGPDRFLSSWLLLETFVREHGAGAAPGVGGHDRRADGPVLGHPAAVAVGGPGPGGRARRRPVEAAMVKDLGTIFEQEVAAVMHEVLGYDPAARRRPRCSSRCWPRRCWSAPSYTIRGGTTEVLRTIAARALGSSR